MLLSLAWSPLCLPSRVSYIGTPQECEKASFVPGYNLGGEGFDIVTMERKGAYIIDTETWKLSSNGSCKLYKNNYMKGEKQKVPVSVVDWRIQPKCRLKLSSKVYDSVEALVEDSTSSVSNDWKVGLTIPAGSVSVGVGFGGSHSRASQFGMEKSKQDRCSFTRHSVYCHFYGYRMATKPPLSQDFLLAVNALPAYSKKTEESYRSLVNIYGTHYFRQVQLGGEIKSFTAIRTCQAALSDLSATEVSDCLSVEASVSFGGSASINAMYKHCQQKKKKLTQSQSFSSTFNERDTEVTGGNINGANILFERNPSVYRDWLNSLKTSPEAVKYNLMALHTVLPHGHRAVPGLKKEVEKYITANGVLKKCAERCQIGHRSSRRNPCACVCVGNGNIDTNCCPTQKGLATLKVFGLYAEDLYGDKWTQTDGSVLVSYAGEKRRTAVINNNDNPKWRESFDFGRIQINAKQKLDFTVYDADSRWNSDLLGKCSFALKKGKVTDSCMFKHGTFFFSYEVVCGPSLGGDQCREYRPASMSPSLAKVFHTRNSILLRDVHQLNESGSGHLF